MDRFTWLLTGPGEFFVDLMFSRSFIDGEARADLAVTLGIVYWLVLLACLRLAWPRLWPTLKRAAREGASIARQPARRSLLGLRWCATRWSWPAAWAVFWRAESVHLALYALVPGWVETMRVVGFAVFLPFTLMMGVGEKRGFYEGTFAHLHQPVCWTFVSWCPSPSAEFLGISRAEKAECQSSGKCPAPVQHSDRYRIVWKFFWALFALAWIVAWRERRLRRDAARRSAAHRPPSG